MSKLAIIKEFGQFLTVSKKWWLTPIVVFLILFGALMVAMQSSALSGFIYAMF
jgi:hypothetical protein